MISSMSLFAQSYAQRPGISKALLDTERNVSLDNSLTYDRHTFWNTTGVTGIPNFDDHKTWNKFKIVNDTSIICPTIIKKNTGLVVNDIFFNKHNYTNGELAMLYVKTNDMANVAVDHKKFVCAHIVSTNDTKGIDVILEQTSEENQANVMKVTGRILMSSIYDSSNYNLGPNIKVNSKGDTLTATIIDSTGNYHTITADVVPKIFTRSSSGGEGGNNPNPPPPSLYPVSQTRYVCQVGQADDICGEWKVGGPLTIQFNGLTYIGPNCPDQYGVACPALGQKDVFLQIDAINGYGPSDTAIQDLVNSLQGSTHGGYGKIFLHVQKGSQIISSVQYNTNGCTAVPCALSFPNDFTSLKNVNFAFDNPTSQDQKSQAYHYALFGYSQYGATGSSGVGELPGNDVFVTLGDPKFNGGTSTGPGSVMEQEGTLMHELGHNLGLDHGGKGDPTNCKPNYLSVMNYLFQFNTLVTGRPLDWSRSVMTSLTQSSLSEPTGISASSPTGLQTTYGDPTGNAVPAFSTGMQNVDFDWNSQSNPESSTAATTLTNTNINQVSSVGCAGNAGATLTGSKDWSTANISFPFRSTTAFKAGSGLSAPDNDMTTEKLKNVLLTRLNQLNHTLQSQSIPPATKTHLNDLLSSAKSSTEKYQYLNASKTLHEMKIIANHQSGVKIFSDSLSDVNLSFKETTPVPRPVTFDHNIYSTGEQVGITVTDPDANLDSTKIDTVTVHISSNADPVGIDKTYFETGPNTGIFQARTVQLASTNANSTAEIVQVNPDDVIYAKYGSFTGTASVAAQSPASVGPSVTIKMGSGSSPSAACVNDQSCFDPNPMTVSSGTTIQWNNNDVVSHTVTSGKPSDNATGYAFYSGLIKPGQTFQFTFVNSGTYDYFCAIHPWMTGQVVVSGNVANTSFTGTNLSFTSGGNTIQNGTTYVPLNVQTTLTNSLATPLKYQYVMQVQNLNNVTVSTSSTSGTASTSSTFVAGQAWTPTTQGKYTISTFVLDPTTHKLLSNPLTRTITVR
jgi:plastocyanin